MTIFFIASAVVTLVAVVATVTLASREATRWPVPKKLALGVVFGIVAWAALYAINTGISAGTEHFIGQGLVAAVTLWALSC